MCWFIICDNGDYIARSSVVAVEISSMESSEVKSLMAKFTKKLKSKLGNNIIPMFDPANTENIYYIPFGSDVEEDSLVLP